MASNNFQSDAIERPFPAYEGDEKYIFISYAHLDAEIVFPEIKKFHDEGYPVWYDQGLTPGQEWDDEIALALMDCSLLVVFISKNSMASNNVQDEIKLALNEKIDIVPIYFEETPLPPGLKLRLSSKHAIMKYLFEEKDYLSECFKAFNKAEIPKIEVEKVKEHDVDSNSSGAERSVEPFEIKPEVSKRIEPENPKERLLDDAIEYDVLYSSINSQSILQYLDDFFDKLELYDDYRNGHHYKSILKSSIDVFLDNNNYYSAFEVFKIFFEIYQITSEDKSRGICNSILNEDNDIFEVIKIIKEYFEENHDKLDKQKNLFIHSVNVFIMGLAIYSQNNSYRDFFEEYVLSSPYEKYYKDMNYDLSHEEFLYRWGITSLMHDIYYPLEMIDHRTKNSIHDKFNSIRNTDLNSIYKLNPYDFADKYNEVYAESKFLDLYNPINLLAHKLYLDFPGLELNQLTTELNNFSDFMKNTEFDEHGFSSALLILNSYSYQIQRYRKDYSFFFYPILDCASAIFLHNYYPYFLQNSPFYLKKLHPSESPLTYLLILCDNILEFYKKPETIVDNNVNNIIDVEVDNNSFNAAYNIKSTSYGFGFSNELNLDEILDLCSVFKKGLYIDVNSNNSMTETLKSNNDSSNKLSMDVLEKIASKIHMNTNEESLEFENLPSDLKMNAIGEAMLISKIFSALGYDITYKTDERKGFLEFSKEEIIAIASLKHEYWCQEKITQGWQYGKEKSEKTRKTPFLVPWDELDSIIQQYDMDSVKNIPYLFDSIGLKIIKNN